MLTVETDPKGLLKDPVLKCRIEESYWKINGFLVENFNNILPINPTKADLAIVAGSGRLEVGFYAAERFKECRLIICSGSRGGSTLKWHLPEAEIFSSIFPFEVLKEPEARNCDENWINSINMGIDVLGRPLDHVFLCCFRLVQRRFRFLSQIHGAGKLEELTIVSPPQSEDPSDFLWQLMLEVNEVRNLQWMSNQHPDKHLVVPHWVKDEAGKLAELGICASEPRTKALFTQN